MSSAVAAHGGLASLYAAMLPPLRPPEPAVDLEAIADAGYESGYAAGRAHAEAVLKPERALLKAATAAVVAATLVDVDAVRGVFITLVRSLAAAVVAGELRVNPEVVSRLVDAALANVLTRDGLVIRLHPGDVERVSLDLPVIADTALAPGAVAIDGPDFVIRDGLDARLATLIEVLL